MDNSKIYKDKLTINLVNRLIEVPKEIKIKCLKKYVSKCKELHTIAFLQWRYLFFTESPMRNKKILEKQITIGLCNWNDDFDMTQRVTKLTRLNASINMNFWLRYDWKQPLSLRRKFSKIMEPVQLPDFTINSFHQIGLIDPFPNDEIKEDLDSSSQDSSKEAVETQIFKRLPERPTHLVYPLNRFRQDQSPICIYIPDKRVMLKLMRACICVTHEDQFWFNFTQK